MKLNCQFTMKVKFKMDLTQDEFEQYKKWLETNPNEMPIDLESITEDVFDGISDIKSERVVEFLDMEHNVSA